jgi:hypothetical protein
MHEPSAAPGPPIPRVIPPAAQPPGTTSGAGSGTARERPLRHGQAFTAGIAAAAAAEGHDAFVVRLRGMYPWVDALTPAQQDAMVAELTPVAADCTRTRHFDDLARAILRWQESTAQGTGAS